MELNKETVKEIINWRHYLHQYPELSYEEHKTTEYICNVLSSFDGLEVKRLTKTGVLGILKGLQETDNAKTILFRADIDALPVTEETDVHFQSKNKGIMHACGHDCHTAMLLGAAKVLSEIRDQLSGEIRFMFQHAEEVAPGGSIDFINAGALEGVAYAFALHVDPHIPVGKFQLVDGVAFGTADDFKAKIIGKGTHAAQPENGIDTIAISAQIISNLQHIASRNISPLKTPVVSVTQIHGGEALNIIPTEVELGGTVRSVHEESRVIARERIEQIIAGICQTHGASYEIEWEIGYPVVKNAKPSYDISKEAMNAIVGSENIIYTKDPHFGTEDFANISQLVPSSMQLIGGYEDRFGESFPLHHPNIKLSDNMLTYGAQYFIQIAKQVLKV